MSLVSREEVIWLYRCLLGRDPESEAAIEHTMALHESFSTAREQIAQSIEFSNNNLAPVFYRLQGDTFPAVKSKTKKLALATIVKNEEAQVEFMLQSCLPLVDFVVVVDTGSVDGTVNIVRHKLVQAGVRHSLIEVTFQDFSHARNLALAAVPSDLDWVIMIDADEHLVPEDYWRLNALLDANVDAWQLPRYNFVDADKLNAPKPYPDYQRRLFRNRADQPISFVGSVHEQPINVQTWGFAPTSEAGPNGFVGGPHIHHMGQVNLSRDRWQQKHDFYTRLQTRDAL